MITWFSFEPLHQFGEKIVTINVLENRSHKGISQTKHEDIIRKTILIVKIVFDEPISNHRN